MRDGGSTAPGLLCVQADVAGAALCGVLHGSHAAFTPPIGLAIGSVTRRLILSAASVTPGALWRSGLERVENARHRFRVGIEQLTAT